VRRVERASRLGRAASSALPPRPTPALHTSDHRVVGKSGQVGKVLATGPERSFASRAATRVPPPPAGWLRALPGIRFSAFFFFPPPPPPSSPPPLFLSQGVTNLIERQHRMVALGPLFCDITWGAGGTTADLTLEIAARMQRDVGVETMMHLTCTNMPVEQLDDALDKVCERWSDEMNADKTRER